MCSNSRGKRTDEGSMCTLLVIHENNGAWLAHGLGAPGVRLRQADRSPTRPGFGVCSLQRSGRFSLSLARGP